MEHIEIANYIDDLEEALCEWNNSPVSWHCELEKMQGLIKQPMDDTFKETDQPDRTTLACLESRASRTKDCIIRRNHMEN